MGKEIIKREDKVAHQLSLIDTINEMINRAKDGKDELGVRQYEHLKKSILKVFMKYSQRTIKYQFLY